MVQLRGGRVTYQWTLEGRDWLTEGEVVQVRDRSGPNNGRGGWQQLSLRCARGVHKAPDWAEQPH